MDELEQYRQRLRIILEAEKICVFEVDGVVCSCSAGAAFYPPDAPDFDALFKKADMALYEAKTSRERVVFYHGGPGDGAPGHTD